MLDDIHEREEEKPVELDEGTSASAMAEKNKWKLKLGIIIGAGFFAFVFLLIIILASTASTNKLPPKPRPVEHPNIPNPFRYSYIHYDSDQKAIVTVANKRQELERNYSSTSFVVINTTENKEPEVLIATFQNLDEHLFNIKYEDGSMRRWVVPDYGSDTEPNQKPLKQIRSPLGVGFLHKENNLFEWNFFGKTHDILALMTTENCRLQYFDKYIEFSARLQTDYIYGMGERVAPFHLKNGNYSLWNRDISNQPGSDTEVGSYSSHPFFLNRLKDRRDFIGVFMRNSNAMLFSFWHNQVNFTTINYKMIGGIVDLYVFHAAEPDYILKKYHNLIGRPYLPPVWAMGFQQARKGYTLADMQAVIKGYSEHRIPIDALWADVELNENYKSFTVDSSRFGGLKEFVKKMHDPKEGIDMRFVVIANTGLKKEQGYKYYDEAIEKNCLILSAKHVDQPYEGKTHAGTTVWLDFMMRDSLLVWHEGLHDLRELSEFDGVWISENEVSNMCDGECPDLVDADHEIIPNPHHNQSEFSYLQFRPTLDPLERSALPMAAYHCCDDLYDKQFFTHNLFGLQSTKATFDALISMFEATRFFVASRSTWPGSGHYGAHWLGYNHATWESLEASISGVLSFNLFGIPHVGAPIGGYFGDADSELLARWYELGCFFPLMLSYSGPNTNRKEVYANEEIRDYIKVAMLERYGLLRFMYTKMFEAHAWGGAVVHPLFFDFPEDDETYKPEIVDATFMWSKTLYVIPALYNRQRTVKAYLPNWRWYDLHGLEMVVDYKQGGVGDYFTFQQPLGHITILVKGGAIIPYQLGAKDAKVMNVEDLKLVPAVIVVAPDHTGKASGTMVVDAEGIRPNPKPRSNTYRHYSFTYMNRIFRINKIAGFDFHETHEYDYFWMMIILDVFGEHTVQFACMMDTDMTRKELEYQHASDSNSLVIHDARYSKIPMSSLESIVWGTNEDYDFCGYQMDIEAVTYSEDGKSLSADLLTTDPHAYQLHLELKAMLMTDKIVSMQIIKTEHGHYPFVVPDVISEDVRTHSKATIPITESGLKLSALRHPFFFEMSDPLDHHDFLFTTRNLPFVYIHNFMHFKFMLNSRHVFGLGERIHKFELTDGIYSLFNYDGNTEETGMAPGNNLYGSHAFYLIQTQNPNEFAGFFLLNSNPIDVRIKHIGMQTLVDHMMVGGIIDAFLFQRGTVVEIVRDYQYLVGKPEPLPFWAFGYHQSRWGYRDIEHLRDVVHRFKEANIPLDAIWMDKDYMENYKTFTVDKAKWHGLSSFVNELKRDKIHFVAIVDAGIARDPEYSVYAEGLERGVYLNSGATGEPLVGVTWPGYTVWIDYLHPAAEKFWEDMLEEFHREVQFDGVWLDMNEPSNFCDGECPDEAHYTYYTFPLDFYDDLYYNPTHRGLETGTVSMEAMHHGGTVHRTEFDYHNLYGFMQSRSTSRFFYARLRKRPFVMSSSTFPGIGRYASHWLGDNFSSWHFMEYSLAGMFNFQLFGIPFVGADVCGFEGNATNTLCSRWMQLGAFYPLMRNHNAPDSNPQEPYVDQKLASISRKAIRTRYSLVRYLYSNYMHVVLEGGMLVKPLLFDFPSDLELYKILDSAFMLGNAIRVTPVFDDTSESIDSYFPNEIWYDFNTLLKVMDHNSSSTQGKVLNLKCSLDSETINLHIKGGSIFPYQDQAITQNVMNINNMTKYPIKLILAPDSHKMAHGCLFYDNDEEINFWIREFHHMRLELYHNELKFVMEEGKASFKYEKADNEISEVVVLGASAYRNTQCAKLYDNKLKAFKYLDYHYDSASDKLTLTHKEEYKILVPNIDSISWYDHDC